MIPDYRRAGLGNLAALGTNQRRRPRPAAAGETVVDEVPAARDSQAVATGMSALDSHGTNRRRPRLVSRLARHGPATTRRILLWVWFAVLVPGGILDLLVLPHAAQTAGALVLLAAVVTITARRWPRALGAVSAVLAVLLLVDDGLEGCDGWGIVSLLADATLLVVALAHWQALKRANA